MPSLVFAVYIMQMKKKNQYKLWNERNRIILGIDIRGIGKQE